MAGYETQHLAVGGQSIAVHTFENIVCVSEAYFQGERSLSFMLYP
jgi:hypothetical protein